jgi:hypothetical protein
MKYQDTGEKFLPFSGKQPDMNDMNINNQVADLMKEKCGGNINVNVQLFGFPKDDFMSQGNAKVQTEKMAALTENPMTFKVPSDGGPKSPASSSSYFPELDLNPDTLHLKTAKNAHQEYIIQLKEAAIINDKKTL